MNDAPVFYKITPAHPDARPHYFDAEAPDSIARVNAYINLLLDNGLAFSVSFVTEDELVP